MREHRHLAFKNTWIPFCSNNLKFPLFTLLAVDDFGKGVPFAWMVASREQTECIITFLAAVRERVRQFLHLMKILFTHPHGKYQFCLSCLLIMAFYIKCWCAQVRKEMPDWEPSCFLMDAADGEIAAVETVFPRWVKIFLCHWHVQRSLKKQLFIKVGCRFAASQ